MRIWNDVLLHSPSDLVRFLSCAHATALDLQKLCAPETLPDKAADDEVAVLVQQAGLAHEQAYLELRRAEGDLIEIAADGDLASRAAATMTAMKSGARTIYQAAFVHEPWAGFADFLIRVDAPSDLGGWSYEPVDTKLARSVKPAYIVQLGLYAEMIAVVQGRAPQAIHVALGNSKSHSFKLVDFAHTLAALQQRYLDFVASGAAHSRPEPCSACTLCGWRDHCADQWEREDHLSRVVGLGKPQAAKLHKAGICTVADLANAPEDTAVKGMKRTFGKLRRQAQLQRARWAGGDPVVECLPIEDDRGFHLLPPPDPADIFFDLEGDPLMDGGLDYLWGMHFSDNGQATFEAQWAHNHEDERKAFEFTVDFMMERLRANPGAHIYHYAPYEVTALKRLASRHASREDAVDHLLRQRRLVDLYSVVRQALRTSEDNLSLKTLEVFFAEKRADAVTNAGQSIVEYETWRQTGDQRILDDIQTYNKVDCENTEALRDWLLGLRPTHLPWRPVGAPAPVNAEADEAAGRAAALIERVLAGTVPPSERCRKLVAYLVQFHRRADKPAFWAMFDRVTREAEDLIDDGDCIGDLEPDHDAGGRWQRPVKRSIVAAYRFPPQDTKLKVGDTVLHAPTLQRLGTIETLDGQAGRVSVKRGTKADSPFPDSGSMIPVPTVGNAALVAAVHRVAGAWADGKEEDAYPALLDLLERAMPRLADGQGMPMVRDGESLIDAAINRCLALDGSYLFIQGPPGTGKTYTAAHAIVALLSKGKKVGVSSNSHKAINNLLERVEQIALQKGVHFNGVRKASGEKDQLSGQIIRDVGSNEQVVAARPDLIGGTAWVFADPALDQYLDYLFIDEAGQVALGNVMAMGTAARNLVLVGDQMQLGQPVQGNHPDDSGLSVLDYLLQGAATVENDRGILLDVSWRMHPEICQFISDAVYDGRLMAHPDCVQQMLHMDDRASVDLPAHGIRFVPMDHSGCGQRSEAEVAMVKHLAQSLMGTPFTDRNGKSGRIDWSNILIVAPFNMQVNALTAALPDGARVGTVDKFQGQEAEVVIISMTSSSPDDLPRHVEFFYSKNRLNVAVSRARTLAIVLANPKLLELDTRNVDHLMLLNTLACIVKNRKLNFIF